MDPKNRKQDPKFLAEISEQVLRDFVAVGIKNFDAKETSYPGFRSLRTCADLQEIAELCRYVHILTKKACSETQ